MVHTAEMQNIKRKPAIAYPRFRDTHWLPEWAGARLQMAPKGRRGVLVTSSKQKKVILEEDDEKLQSQREWETLA